MNAPQSLARMAVKDLELGREVCLYGVAGRQRTPVAATFMKMLRAANWPNDETLSRFYFSAAISSSTAMRLR